MYGVADLRGKSGRRRHCRYAGDRGFALPGRAGAGRKGGRQTTARLRRYRRSIARTIPSGIAMALQPARDVGCCHRSRSAAISPDVEQRLIPALQILQGAQRSLRALAGLLWQGLIRTPDGADGACLARLGLDHPRLGRSAAIVRSSARPWHTAAASSSMSSRRRPGPR